MIKEVATGLSLSYLQHPANGRDAPYWGKFHARVKGFQVYLVQRLTKKVLRLGLLKSGRAYCQLILDLIGRIQSTTDMAGPKSRPNPLAVG
jgi:hypothetical protein